YFQLEAGVKLPAPSCCHLALFPRRFRDCPPIDLSEEIRPLHAAVIKAGIVKGESVLGQLWQIAGKKASARSHETEDHRAYAQYVKAREKHDRMRIAQGKFYVMDLLKDRPDLMEFMAPTWLREVRAGRRAEALAVADTWARAEAHNAAIREAA
ncbi:hypothetical protein, partial [Paraburkholderia sp. DGU8]|uniref:hypothetical protein n=1 Tax=Paraburkholderia sp. DGU8 TaxID=3161997 RepID=UPI003465998A